MPQLYGDRWEIKESLDEGGQAHTFLTVDIKGGTQTLYVLKRLKIKIELLDLNEKWKLSGIYRMIILFD